MRRGHIPERTCRSCGCKVPKTALIRLVVVEGRGLVEDRQDRLPGKGIYCCDERTCRERLEKNKRVLRAG